MLIYAKHEPYDHRLAKITAEMRNLGAPVLKAVEYRGELFALEGSHRLAAADYLGLCPTIVLQPTEADGALDVFWDKVADRLPRYSFRELRIIQP